MNRIVRLTESDLARIVKRVIKENKFKSLFGFNTRKEEEEITQTHCNMSLAIQKVTEEIVIKMVRETKKLTNSNNLCLSGGVALNCVANGKIEELGIFENIYIQYRPNI